MGWKPISIGKGGAKLQQAGRSIDLLLYPDNKPKSERGGPDIIDPTGLQ